MNAIGRPYFLAVIYLAGVCILTSIAGCSDLSQEQSKKVENALRDTLVSSTESWNINMKLLEAGRKKLTLKGQRALSVSREDTQYTRISGPVHISVFDSTGAIRTRVRSNRAVYFSNKSVFKLYGDVRVVSDEKRRLRTEYLRWNQADNRVHSPRFVTIITKKDSITGHGFSGTVDLSSYQIQQVTGRVTIEQQDTTR